MIAGPGRGPLPRRLRRRRAQGRAARHRRQHPRHGRARPRRRHVALLEARVARTSAARSSTSSPTTGGRRSCAWSRTPTSSSRTSGPARSSGSVSVPDVLLEREPDAGDPARHRVRAGRARTPAGPGFATHRRGDVGLRVAINGEPDGGPLLPPIALTDEVTALVGAFATMVALWSGVGQVVDVNLLESLFQCMGPLPARLRDHRLPAAAPRLRHPLLRAPRHLAVRRRPLGRGLHVGRVGGRRG